MKKKLEKKLLKVDRKFKWFWVNHIKKLCTYQHFMEQLNDNSPMRDDVKKAIKAYLES